MTIYHVILTKEDVDADWIISNGYRDMSGVESDDNFFVDISGGQIPLDRTGTVGVVVTSKGFNEAVTGNVSNGINSNFVIDYVYFKKNKRLKIYTGLDYSLAFTKNRRTYNLSNMSQTENKLRLDQLFGIHLGIIIPINRKNEEEFHYF